MVEVMELHGMSAREVGVLVGVGRQTVDAWVERGASSAVAQQLLARVVSKRGMARLRRVALECDEMSQPAAMLMARELRLSLCLSLREMARLLTTSQSSVRAWETRQCDGPARRLVAMLRDSKDVKRGAERVKATRAPKNNAWSDVHVALVRAMVSSGAPVCAIADAVGRSEAAVRSRMSRMGISLSGGAPPHAT